MQWYYANDGQRQGPVSPEEFARLVEAGVIRAQTLVWRAGMASWKAYGELAPPPLDPVPGIPATPAASPSAGDGGSAATQAAGPSPTTAAGAAAAATDVAILGYGGFWRRVAAKFIDGLITGIVSWIVSLPVMLIFFGAGASLMSDGQLAPEELGLFVVIQAVSVAIQTVIVLAYQVFFIRKYAATPGKMALGLRIYRSDSSRLTVGRIIGRHFAEWLNAFTLGIGYLIAAFDDEKRALHDHICDTRVVLVRK